MIKIVLSFLFGVLIYGCTNYENKERYTISVGEKVEVYYFTNSCCTFEIANFESLDNIQYLEEKSIDTGPNDCSGCESTYAFVFRAISPGVDTLKLKHRVHSKPNDTLNNALNKFIVEVYN